MKPLTILQTHIDAFVDTKNSHPVIRIYGTCLDGSPVICHITNFQPYFYITNNNLQNLLTSKAFIPSLIVSFNIQSKVSKITRIEKCYKRSIYGYSQSESLFLKVFFNNFQGFSSLKSVFENGFTVCNKVLCFSVFESHILYVMRFMIDKGISGMSYVRLSGYAVLQGNTTRACDFEQKMIQSAPEKSFGGGLGRTEGDKFSIEGSNEQKDENNTINSKDMLNSDSKLTDNLQSEELPNSKNDQPGNMKKYQNDAFPNINAGENQKSTETLSETSNNPNTKNKIIVLATTASHIFPCEHEDHLSKLPPLKILSFDIECISLSDRFPDPSVDPVIQIGNTVCLSSDIEKNEQVIFCLRKTASIPSAKVLSFDTEEELLVGWYEYFMSYDPDIVIGYNIKTFDFPYLLQRAKVFNLGFFNFLGRRYEKKATDSLIEDDRISLERSIHTKSLNHKSVGESLSKNKRKFPGFVNSADLIQNMEDIHETKNGPISFTHKNKDSQNERCESSSEFLTDSSKNVNNFSHTSHSENTLVSSNAEKQSENNTKNHISSNFENLSNYNFHHTYEPANEINLDGRMVFDMLNVVRKEVNLRSYTLNAVSVALLNSQKEDVPYHAMQGLYNGTPETRRRLASYCLVDTVLPLKLFKQLYVLENYAEMARVTGVPLLFLSERGQAVRVLSQVLRKSKDSGYVVPQVQISEQSFEGGFVMDPERGFYQDPVAVLDFSSLYPSIMIRHNLCYSTMVLKKDSLSSGFNVKSNEKNLHEKSILRDLTGSETSRDSSNGVDSFSLDQSVNGSNNGQFESKRPSSIEEISNRNFNGFNSEKSEGNRPSGIVKIEYENLAEKTSVSESKNIDSKNFMTKSHGETKSLTENEDTEIYTKSPSGDIFVKPRIRKGVLPQILEELISERRKTRKRLETTTDPELRASLDARQKALKIAANSVYGFTGAAQGQLPCLQISQSVTSFGRFMINKTKEVIEGTYNTKNGFSHNAKVIYGDTDSVMIDFGEKDIFKVFELSRKVSKEVSRTFEKPISLEFEKVYCPYLLMNKKRYAGLAYTDPGPDFRPKNSGVNCENGDAQNFHDSKKNGLSSFQDSHQNTDKKSGSAPKENKGFMSNENSDEIKNENSESDQIDFQKSKTIDESCQIRNIGQKSRNKFLESSGTNELDQNKVSMDSRIHPNKQTSSADKKPSISDLKGRVDTKGIETVRRDNCEMVRVAMETCLHYILFKKDIQGAINFVKQTISDLFNNKIDLSQLVITKQLTKPGESYAVKQAHVQLASKLTKRENTKINVGDRISYVIVKGDKNSPAYVRSEDPVFVLQNNLPIDTQYYLQNQLIKPIYRLFEPIIQNVSVLTTGAHTTESKYSVSNKGIAASLIKKTECIGCRSLGKILCNQCTPSFTKHYLTLQTEFNEQKRVFAKCWTQCQNCQGSVINEVLCVNRDCPIFYKRTRVKKDLEEIEEKFTKLSNLEW